MVSRIRWGSVDSRIKMDLAGGSSSVFRKALAACVFNRSAAAMMATLYSASVVLSWISRINSRVCSTVTTRDLDSGRAQWMSTCVSLSFFRQLGHSSQLSVATPPVLTGLAVQRFGQGAGEPFEFFQPVAGEEIGV